jgi:hypothetical protein
VQSFYDGRAMESFARCPNPRIAAIIRATVVEDTPERLVMALRYRWRDDTQTIDSGSNGGSRIVCQDWSERRFTFARDPDGRLRPIAMSGPQKQRRIGAAAASEPSSSRTDES